MRRRRKTSVNTKLLLVIVIIYFFIQTFFINNKVDRMLLRTQKATLAVNLIGCDRAYQYELALKSLANAASVGNYKDKVIVYASVDCKHYETINMVKSWEKYMKDKLNVVYVESYQMRLEETPEQAEKLDERVARHWLSSNNRVFNRGYDNVIYLESDHVVSTDFFTAAESLIKFTDDYCPKCFMSNLGCHGNCLGNFRPGKSRLNELAIYPLQNIGIIYRRYGWERLMRNINLFCEILGDWDINMNTLLANGIEDVDPRSPGYTIPRVFHTTTCYTSRRKHDIPNVPGCDFPNKMHDNEYNEFINKFKDYGGSLDNLKLTNRIVNGRASKKWPADPDTKKRCFEAAGHI